MTERENLLKLLRHEKPEWLPFYSRAMTRILPSCVDETMLLTQGGVNLFGVKWVTTEGTEAATTPDVKTPPLLKDISEWREKVHIPDVDAMAWEECAEKDMKNVDRESRLLYSFGIIGVFDHLLSMMGVEGALCAMIEEPDEVKALFQALTDYRIQVIKKIKKYYDLDVWVDNDDVATAGGLFISPDLYRELVWPFEKATNDAAHEVGMYVQHHCCGKCDCLIPDFIAAGNDSWEPAQSINDLKSILENYGDQIAVIGGWDSSGACSRLDAPLEDVVREAERCLNEYGQYDGYSFYPVLLNRNSVGYQEKQDAIAGVYDNYIKNHR